MSMTDSPARVFCACPSEFGFRDQPQYLIGMHLTHLPTPCGDLQAFGMEA